MTVNRGVGVAKNGAVGTTTLEHRLQQAGLYAENAPGVPRSGVLSQSNAVLVSGKADMSYDIGPCALVISRTASEGVYTPTLTGVTNVPTTAAPSSGSRWDLVWVKQNDMAKGDAGNLAVRGVTQGAASGSPSKPYGSVPAGALVLAEVEVFALITATTSASITQVWRHTVARGAPIPVRSQAEQDEITPGNGTRIRRLDLKFDAVWNGTRWVGGVGTIPAFGSYSTFGGGYVDAMWRESCDGDVTLTAIFKNSNTSVTTVPQVKYKVGAVPSSIAPAGRIPAPIVADAAHDAQPFGYVETTGDIQFSVNSSGTSTGSSFFVAYNMTWRSTV